MQFEINGILWNIIFVEPWEEILWTGNGYTLGVTELDTQTVYLNNRLSGDMLERVLSHELCHSAIYSYGYDMEIPQEECFCQIMENHGDEIGLLTKKFFEKIS